MHAWLALISYNIVFFIAAYKLITRVFSFSFFFLLVKEIPIRIHASCVCVCMCSACNRRKDFLFLAIIFSLAAVRMVTGARYIKSC